MPRAPRHLSHPHVDNLESAAAAEGLLIRRRPPMSRTCDGKTNPIEFHNLFESSRIPLVPTATLEIPANLVNLLSNPPKLYTLENANAPPGLASR